MQIKALGRYSHTPLQNSYFRNTPKHSSFLFNTPQTFPPRLPAAASLSAPTLRLSTENAHSKRLIAPCVGQRQGLIEDVPDETVVHGGENGGLEFSAEEQESGVAVVGSKREELGSKNIWRQMKEVLMFSGPATALWICAPLMSLVSTAVVGQGSSTELAALGPGTVFCDNMNLLFMFLSIATSNMVATSLAKGDQKDVQHQISILLFVGLSCGVLMLLFTQFLGSWALTGFAGAKNMHIVPVASKYVQIRALSWPAYLYGLVAQSASLGMKDSMGPLKALVVATAVNGIGHLILCSFLGYGIAGAAWATMTSQVISSYMMIQTLNKKGYNPFTISVPSPKEFLQIFAIAAPVFATMFSKVAFYSLITYFATAMGTFTVAAHQVMIQTYGMFVVWGEPLSQTAQSFMPELLYGVDQGLDKARTLIKSLLIIGALLGGIIGIVGAFIPWLLPNMFTSDLMVIKEMHKVLVLFFFALAVTPCTHSLEGTLLAGRDLKFISLSMSGCFCLGALLLLLVNNGGFGLPGCWSALVAFQWARFVLALWRLLSPDGMLHSNGPSQYKLGKLKAA